MPGKKTKFICTIGPSCSDAETLRGMVEAGMNDHANTDARENLAPILEADAWARSRAAALIPSIP